MSLEVTTMPESIPQSTRAKLTDDVFPLMHAALTAAYMNRSVEDRICEVTDFQYIVSVR